MIDVLGISEIGFSRNGKGLFIYKDGSVGMGFKLPGIKDNSMTVEEMENRYENLRNIIGQLELLYKKEGALYQFVSQPNYNIDAVEKMSKQINYIDKEKNLSKNGTLFKGILDKNIRDTFTRYRNAGAVTRDNYIFVRLYVNMNSLGVQPNEFLRRIFILKETDNEKIKLVIDKIETLIERHTSKFKALKAEGLELLEMINVKRKYFGFSELKKLPNLNTNDEVLFHLFPGKVEINEDHIKTTEKIDISDDKKKEFNINENKLEMRIKQNIEKEKKILADINSVECKTFENEIDYLIVDILKFQPEIKHLYNVYDKHNLVKHYVYDLTNLSNISDLMENFKLITPNTLKIYKAEKEFFYDRNIKNNDTYLKVFSMKELPSMLNLFHGKRLNSLYGDYTITLNFKKLDNLEAQTKMRRQVVMENIKLGMPVMKWFIPIEAVEDKIENLRYMIRTLDRRDWSRVEASLFVTLRSHKEKDEREQEIGEYENITELKFEAEKHSAPFMILTNAMPGRFNKNGQKMSRRSLLLNTTNIAQLSPMMGEENGAKTPVLSFMGEESLINFNLNEAKAGHLAIQGGTGGGKSFFGNKLLLQYLMFKDKCITTERGDSFTRSTLFFGGKVYKPDMSGKIKINPFVMPSTAWEDDEMRKSIYRQMVRSMSQMCDNYDSSIQQQYYKLIKSRFETDGGSINRRLVEENAVTPSKLLQLMKNRWDTKAYNKEISSFEKFTKNGLYGILFDGNSGLNMDYPAINIDYSKLSDPSIKDFVFKSLLQNVFNEMSKSSGQTFFNINDEFWDAISTSGATGDNVANTAIGQVEAFFRVARKLGGKIAVISQAISDIADSPLAKAVLNNIYHSFFTNTSTAGELKVISELFQLQEHQLQQIKTLSQVPGKYSEYFAIAPYGEKSGTSSVERKLTTKFKYFPTPFETALFTTHPQEKAIFKMIYEEGKYGDDPSSVSQERVMKAVRLFMTIIPKGVNEPYFQERLLYNSNDYLFTFRQLVEERYGSVTKALDTVNWYEFINLVEK